MFKLLKKTEDESLKEFVGQTIRVHKNADGTFKGVFNNVEKTIPADCLGRAKAEEGFKKLLDLFIKGRQRLEKKFGVKECNSQYKLTYEHENDKGEIGVSIFTNASADFLHHDCIITLARLYNMQYKDVFEKVSKALAPQEQKPLDEPSAEPKEE